MVLRGFHALRSLIQSEKNQVRSEVPAIQYKNCEIR